MNNTRPTQMKRVFWSRNRRMKMSRKMINISPTLINIPSRQTARSRSSWRSSGKRKSKLTRQREKMIAIIEQIFSHVFMLFLNEANKSELGRG